MVLDVNLTCSTMDGISPAAGLPGNGWRDRVPVLVSWRWARVIWLRSLWRVEYTTLCAPSAFKAGASCLHGVSDLEALAWLPHKFESRHQTGWLDPTRNGVTSTGECSPIHLTPLTVRVIFFQGQRTICSAWIRLKHGPWRKGLSVACGVPLAEQHGFHAENIKRAWWGEITHCGTQVWVLPKAVKLKTIENFHLIFVAAESQSALRLIKTISWIATKTVKPG